MENFFDNQRIFKALWRWKIHLIVIVAIAALASVIFSSSLFIQPKFKSAGKIYPVNLAEYSEESESEQLLEFISGNDLKFRIIDAFNLAEVYKINPNDPLYKTYILAKYDKNVSFKKTKFESIEIKVLDVDPKRAANMVDSIITFFNQKIQRLHSEKYFEVYNIANRDINFKYKAVDSLQNLISQLRKEYGLLDYKLQVESSTYGLMEASARNGNPKPAKDMIEGLQEKGGEFDWLQRRLRTHERIIDSLTVIRDFSFSHATKTITYCIVVEEPFPADKKSYPIRWLILFLSVVSALAVGMVAVVTIDYLRAEKLAE
jgi:capsular polysaccharide biosynthesis protein